MSYYSNRFLGSNNNGFVNNGTIDMNVNSIQVQNLSPNELVATDSNKNLISVPYPNPNPTPIYAYISITDRNNLNYNGTGTFTFGLTNTISNISFNDNQKITVQTAGVYLINYCVIVANSGSSYDLNTFISKNGASISPDNPTLASAGGINNLGNASNSSILNLIEGDNLSLNFVAYSNFIITSISLSMTLINPSVSSTTNQTLQNEIDALTTQLNSVKSFIQSSFNITL